MSTPPDVTQRTRRRTSSGCSSPIRAAMTPPIDCATRSTGWSILAVTNRFRSSTPRIAGSCGCAPRPGQPKCSFAQAEGSASATGFQN